jgi:hypothetical protein
MSQYDNEKKFALFKNDKGENPKRPDYRGTLTLGGVEYKLSAWIREDKKGSKYMNGSVELKTEGAPKPMNESAGSYTPSPTQVQPPAKFTPGGGHTPPRDDWKAAGGGGELTDEIGF